MERVLAKQPVKNDQTKPELITNAKDFFHACSTSYFLCSVRFFFLISFTLSFVSVSVCCFSPHIFAFHAIIIVSCPWYFPFDDVRPYSVLCALYVSLCVRERNVLNIEIILLLCKHRVFAAKSASCWLEPMSQPKRVASLLTFSLIYRFCFGYNIFELHTAVASTTYYHPFFPFSTHFP